MSTIQIVGIAAAAVIVVLLVIALLVTRKGGGDEASERTDSSAGNSFLDSAPSDTLAKLGKPEDRPAPAAEVGAESGPAPAPQAKVVMTATGVAAAANGDLGLDWDHGDEKAPKAAPPPDETQTTGEIPAVTEPAVTLEDPGGEPIVEVEPAEEAPPRIEAVETEAATPEPSDNLVPLSSIIVTTSTKMVDLEDPEIRRMLTDLVTFEIDQATQFREQGQTIDAVLQLTEAEKICRALGKRDTAREIRDMMRGLQA